MDIRLILDYELPRLERELGGEVIALARPLLLQPAEQRDIRISDNERYIVEELGEGVTVESDAGQYNTFSEAIEELVEVHRGNITITNNSNRQQVARFVSLHLRD